jgi:hypothetical protein
MAKALQPAVAAGEIFFELDRFEHGESDRLELGGRWFGVRGRRFVRPSLELLAEAGPMRALADLEHKPWAAEDGEYWEAAFPWDFENDVLEVELSVAPDITIRLPAPGAELDSARRISVRRRRHPSVGTRAEHSRGAELDPEPVTPRARSRPAAPPRDEREALGEQLAALREQLEQARAELESAQLASAESANSAAAASVELAAAEERRDAALSGMQAAIAARDAAAKARDELARERDHGLHTREQLASERDRARRAAQRLKAELEQARGALQEAVRERQEAVQDRDRARGERDAVRQSEQQLVRERDEATAARGAALVMRNATRAVPGQELHAGWIQRGLAIVLLVGAMFALLIILHVL